MSPTWSPEIFNWHWRGTVLAPLPTFCNYNWPNALKPSHKSNTSSTVITRPPNWNNTVTLIIEAVHSSKMSAHLTSTQVRKPNNYNGQINNCMKSPKLLQIKFFITLTHYRIVPMNQVVFKTEKRCYRNNVHYSSIRMGLTYSSPCDNKQ
jgi:hypothetical protein